MKFTAKDIDKIYEQAQPKKVDTLVRKQQSYVPLPTKAQQDPKESKVKSFAKTAGYRAAADVTNTGDALTYAKLYKMADNKESSNRIAENASKKNITLSARQKMQTKANNLVDKDKLKNKSETTKKLQQKATDSETRLKQGNGKVANALIDIGLAGTDMLGKAAVSSVTGVPLPVLIGVTSGANSFQNAINEGKDIDKALNYGVGSGAISGGIESLTGIGASKIAKLGASKLGTKVLSQMPPKISSYLTKASGTTLGKVLKDATGEGLEEGLEYDAQRIYRNLLMDEETPRDIKEQAYNMLIGAGVGGLFGGGRVAMDSIGKKSVKQIVEENPIEEIKKPTVQDIVKQNPIQELSTQSPKLPTVAEIVKSNPIEEVNQEVKKSTVAEIVKQNPIEEIAEQPININQELASNNVQNIKATNQPLINENIQGKQTLEQGTNFAQNVNNDVTEQINNLPIQNNANVVDTQTVGVIQDENSKAYRIKDTKTHDTLDRLSKSVGVKVKFFPMLENDANGLYNPQTNTIDISLNADDPVMTVAKHELTHAMQNKDTQLYNEYKNYIVKAKQKNGNYQTEYDNLVKLYDDYKIPYNKDLLDDEIVSNASASLFADKETIAEMINYNPTMAEKIHAFIKDIINKIKKVDSEYSLRQLQKAEKLWSEMLNSSISKNVSTETNNETKFSLKDSKGNTLTKEQQEFFKDSKVRDDKGNLRVVHHGTKKQFTQFSKELLGTNTDADSAREGFFFTSNSEMAELYKRPTSDPYYNTKPLLEFLESLSEEEIQDIARKLRIRIDDVEYMIDDIESDFRQFEYYDNVDGYRDGIKTIEDLKIKTNTELWQKVKDVFNAENGYKMDVYLNINNPFIVNDMDMYEDEGFTGVIKQAKELKHDGVIIKNVQDGAWAIYDKEGPKGDLYVAFEPNQIKDTTNANPTENPDIRLSLKKELKPQKEEIKKVTTEKAKKLPSKSQLTILNEAYTRLKQAQENNKEESKVADILTSTKQTKLPIKDGVKDSVDAFKRKFVDSGNTIATVSQLVKDSTLYTMYNNARQARQSAEYMLSENQTDAEGNVVGKSLVKIFEPIRKRGDDYYKDFSKYMFNRHNMARMEQGKPVFGESKTAEISEKEMMQAERLHPEYVDYANEIYEYNRNLMQYRIDTGLISQEQANIMNEMYPNYVPTYRDTSTIAGSRATNNSVEITNGIKKATGSDKDLLPLHEQIARQTMQVVQAGKRNMFGNRLLADVLDNKETLGKYIQGIETKKVEDAEVEEDVETEEIPELKNTFVIFNNGERTIMKVNSGMFEGVKALSSTGREVTSVEKGAKAINSTFKKLITAYNPLFTVKNIARDIQDAGLYSKDINAFMKAYPKALKEITTNGELWQKYQALGGFGSSVFDYEQGYLLKERNNKFTKGVGFIGDKVEALNFVTEQMPRFTEFVATLEKGDGSYANLMEAMYNAADITVNFGRSGTWGKVLNSTFVPFFNPAVQGTSKFVKLFTETKGTKDWTRLVLKAATLGIAPAILNALMYDDDEEYKKITNRDKDLNYIFKIKKDLFVKIPKGRVIGLIGNATQRTLRSAKGEENSWAGFISTAADNTLPMNPFTETIIAPVVAVSNNKTWYGTPIEGQSLQNFKPSERYDEKTDSFSIALGKLLNYSPKKINYLLDSYTGVIGDFALPLMTKKAETDPFRKAFTIDSTLSNKIAENFYNKLEEITYNKNSIDDDNVNDVIYRFINKQSTAVSDLSKEMKAIEKSDLTNKEKQVKVKELKAIMNGIQQNALDNLKEYERTANKYFREYTDVDDAYIYTNKDLFGAEYALKTYNKKIYEKYLDQKEMTAEQYFNWYFEQLEDKREKAEEKKNSLPTVKTKTTTKPKIKLPTIKGS